jgi:hypothetical protein
VAGRSEVEAEAPRIADGLWRWTARHPEWHPGEFGAEVAAWAVREGGGTVLVDPILPAELLPAVDRVVSGPVTVVVTIPYHVRDAALAAERWGGEILGHAAVARRLPAGAPFRAVAAGDELPLGLSVHRIGNPRRYEQPLLLPAARALAFGDAVVGVDGGLRVWVQEHGDERRLAWYRERLVPSLEPLLELPFERVLVTHGEPVLSGGRDALAEALAAPPWHHRG